MSDDLCSAARYPIVVLDVLAMTCKYVRLLEAVAIYLPELVRRSSET
jgi:hypothetical protein